MVLIFGLAMLYIAGSPYDYLFYYFQPYKSLVVKPENPRILLGMLSIDRDADITNIVYEKNQRQHKFK